ncbi:MAG: NUDIX domain-containing protein [Acidiferrobacterales bacterium]|nr:NUDIX domain-containing protein [Acidiferrobacterales bacterium]
MTETEEIFDVVNSRDMVIDRLPRSQVHARNLLHRSVHALVFDADQRVFLQLRTDDRDCDPGLWDSSVGGHLQAGEDYDNAIVREAKEELGIVLESTPPRLFKLSASEDTAYEFCWVYQVFDDGPFQLDSNEAADGRWFTAQEISDWITNAPQTITSSFRLIWKNYLEIRFGND